MTTQRKITQPGSYDNEFMLVTCTPDKTSVEFFEYEEEREAMNAARLNLHPTVTTYFGTVTAQGEHAVRGKAKHVAILVEVDAELAAALSWHSGAKGRGKIAAALEVILKKDLDQIIEDHKASKVVAPPVVAPPANAPAPAPTISHWAVLEPVRVDPTERGVLVTAPDAKGRDKIASALRRVHPTEGGDRYPDPMIGNFGKWSSEADAEADCIAAENQRIRREFQEKSLRCLTPNCAGTRSNSSDYCPPCQSIRSGHGL